MASNGTAKTAFEQALTLCTTAEERERVQRLAVRLHLSENAQEWAVLLLHAEGREIFGKDEAEQKAVTDRLDRVEALLRKKSSGNPMAAPMRDVMVFGIAFVAFIAITWFSAGHATSPVTYALAIVIGLAGAIAYLRFLPQIK